MNKVVHEGKQPNPMEVVPIVQTLSCRYKEVFSNHPGSNNRCCRTLVAVNQGCRG